MTNLIHNQGLRGTTRYLLLVVKNSRYIFESDGGGVRAKLHNSTIQNIIPGKKYAYSSGSNARCDADMRGTAAASLHKHRR